MIERLSYYPEILPGWESLPADVHARHVSLTIPREQSRPEPQSRKVAVDMLRQHLVIERLKPFEWKRWRFPLDADNDAYVVGCLSRKV